jgi:hypothetical protein
MATPPLPTGIEQSELDEAWNKLFSEAMVAMLEYMNQHCPPELQPHLKSYVENLSPPVGNGTQIEVQWQDGSKAPGSPGTADVSGAKLNFVKLSAAPPEPPARRR